MKVTANYEGKSIEIEIPDEKLKELIAGKKRTGYERVNIGSRYCYNAVLSGTRSIPCDDRGTDRALYDAANYYNDKNFAENIARAEKLYRRIRRRIAEICEPVDWNDSRTSKWVIIFDYTDGTFTTLSCRNATLFGSLCCDTQEHAEQIIKEFHDELIWYFTEYRDRMDGGKGNG